MELTTQQSLKTHNAQSSKTKSLYLSLTVLSLVISWGIFSQFLFSGEASISLFFQQLFETHVAALETSDVLLCALIFFAFAYIELKRLGVSISRMTLYAAAFLCVGTCFALALFLYHRESWLEDSQIQKLA